MEQFYKIAELSRQGFHKWRNPKPSTLERTPEDMALDLAKHIRKDYLPGFSARMIYDFIRNSDEYDPLLKGWGKHTFEKLCLSNGLRLVKPRPYIKTTQRGSYMFPNLISNMTIDNINRIWVSDMCYVFNSAHFPIGYATTMMDVYSRRLLGLTFSQRLTTEQTCQVVIDQAINTRGIAKYDNLIFHSDGGKQYIETNFISTLRKHKIKSSMAYNALENGFAESLNDVLKNSYVRGLDVNSFNELKNNEEFIKYSYNHYKPHSGIDKYNPIKYEQYISTLQQCQRTKLLIKEISK